MIENELNQRFKFILNGTPEAEASKNVSTYDYAFNYFRKLTIVPSMLEMR